MGSPAPDPAGPGGHASTARRMSNRRIIGLGLALCILLALLLAWMLGAFSPGEPPLGPDRR